MRDLYILMIVELDRILDFARELWLLAGLEHDMEAADKWRRILDRLLDERLRLMRVRDGAA